MNSWGKAVAPGMFPALSLRQPWAWAVVHGGKDIENRVWSTKFRGEFLIHAAAWPSGDIERLAERLSVRLKECEAQTCDMLNTARGYGAPPPVPVTLRQVLERRGGFVAMAEIVDVIPPCIKRMDSIGLFGPAPCEHRWHMPEQYGFRLANVRPVPFTPWKGALGFFGVPREVADPLVSIARSATGVRR
jgi:hypothetical protein